MGTLLNAGGSSACLVWIGYPDCYSGARAGCIHTRNSQVFVRNQSRIETMTDGRPDRDILGADRQYASPRSDSSRACNSTGPGRNGWQACSPVSGHQPHRIVDRTVACGPRPMPQTIWSRIEKGRLPRTGLASSSPGMIWEPPLPARRRPRVSTLCVPARMKERRPPVVAGNRSVGRVWNSHARRAVQARDKRVAICANKDIYATLMRAGPGFQCIA